MCRYTKGLNILLGSRFRADNITDSVFFVSMYLSYEIVLEPENADFSISLVEEYLQKEGRYSSASF